ncbi:MAG: hypothetical protein HYX52_06815 [Chloroflexi bacterium]|nr:hypothetical protein [Chloroflexota bacterium]
MNTRAPALEPRALDGVGVSAALARLGHRVASSERAAWLAKDVLVPFIGTRAVLLLAAWLATHLLPAGPFPGIWANWPEWWMTALSNWDGRWYLSIVRDGYNYLPDQQSNIAFSPLYPLSMWALAGVVGARDELSWLLAGITVSNVSLLASMALLRALVRLDHDARTAGRAALYLALFPTSLFLSALYADSLYLALALGALYAARRRAWCAAGTLGALATLARPHGVLIGLPLAIEYGLAIRAAVRSRGAPSVRAWLHPGVLWLGLIPLALVAWAAYVFQLTGDPLAFMRAQAAWGRELTPPWETLRRMFDGPLYPHGGWWGWDHSMLDLAAAVLFLALVTASFRLVRPSLAIYGAAVFLTMVSNGALAADMRYGLAIVPAFVVLALAGRLSAFHQAYLVGASVLSAVFTVLFSAGYWVA